MNQIELEKIADFFDKDRNGIDLSEILRVLKGNKRGKYVVQEAAMTDAQKIENEVCTIINSHCDWYTRQHVISACAIYRFNFKCQSVPVLTSSVSRVLQKANTG